MTVAALSEVPSCLSISHVRFPDNLYCERLPARDFHPVFCAYAFRPAQTRGGSGVPAAAGGGDAEGGAECEPARAG